MLKSNFENNLRLTHKKMKALSIIYCLIALPFFCQTKNILFVGNSYTYYNSLPQLTAEIALSFGDTILWDSSTPGGYTFNQHCTNATTQNKISLGNWDHVILQEQSQLPSFPPFQVASDCFPYAAKLVDTILFFNPCTEPIFFMTWGRENGDQTNCANYPPLCTYDGMQGRLRESYLQMSVDNQATVSPVGAAWKYVRDNHPSIDLYTSDGSHPSIFGSYLAACVHYATIYRTSPVGTSFTSSINQSDANILQQAAAIIVLDSLETWRIGANETIADFSYQINGAQVSFVFNGVNTDSVEWNFGDGGYSNSLNPDHEFTSNGIYEVALIAYSNCYSDTIFQSIEISGLGIADNTFFTVEHFNNVVNVNFNSSSKKMVTLFNSIGKIIFSNECYDNTFSINVPNGELFILSIYDERYGTVSRKIFHP